MKSRSRSKVGPLRTGPGIKILIGLGWLSLLLAACSSPSEKQNGKGSSSEPPKSSKKVRFELQERPYGHILRIFHGEDRTDSSSYQLRKKGRDKSEENERAIRVPVERIACLSTTHIGMLKALDAEDRVVGFPSRDLLYDSTLRRRMKEGKIEGIGGQGSIDTERIIALDPDILIDDGMSGGSKGKRTKLRNGGIEVLDVLEWKETHPLHRAEWLKVFGALVGKAEKADSILRARKAAYDSLARIGERAKSSPKVLCNALHRGTWYVPGGNSFMTRLIKDAGGSYPWEENESTGGVPKSLEEVIAKAGDADVWLNPGDSRSLEDLEEKDERIEKIRAFQDGRVFNNDRRKKPGRGNDHWESGPVHPERILADLVRILHPDLLPDHEFHYYRRLDPSS